MINHQANDHHQLNHKENQKKLLMIEPETALGINRCAGRLVDPGTWPIGPGSRSLG